jgi:hypothetical protein
MVAWALTADQVRQGSVERRADDLVQDGENLVDEHVGGSGADIGRTQHRDTVLAGNAVEVGEIDDEKLVQANQLANQIAPLLLSPRRQSTVPTFIQRLGNRDTGNGNKRADAALESRCAIGFGWGGRREAAGGSGVHGARSRK